MAETVETVGITVVPTLPGAEAAAEAAVEDLLPFESLGLGRM